MLPDARALGQNENQPYLLRGGRDHIHVITKSKNSFFLKNMNVLRESKIKEKAKFLVHVLGVP